MFVTRNYAPNSCESHPWKISSRGFFHCMRSLITGNGRFESKDWFKDAFGCSVAARVDSYESIRGVLNRPYSYELHLLKEPDMFIVASGIPEDHEHRFIGAVKCFKELILFNNLKMFCVEPTITEIFRFKAGSVSKQTIEWNDILADQLDLNDVSVALEFIKANVISNND